jgi:hypothetical protein
MRTVYHHAFSARAQPLNGLVLFVRLRDAVEIRGDDQQRLKGLLTSAEAQIRAIEQKIELQERVATRAASDAPSRHIPQSNDSAIPARSDSR